jgi:cytoskeletal protein RodZ
MTRRRIGLLVAWAAATAIATLLASQAVAMVRDQVTDRPSRVATTLALETTTSTTEPSTTTPPPSLVTTTTLSEPTTATVPATTSTTQVDVATTSTPTTTSTTTPSNQEQTFYLTGGWATVRCAADDVSLATYAPNPGYQVEIESAGPNRVEIKFEESGGDGESRLEVRCDDGVLDPSYEEHEDD